MLLNFMRQFKFGGLIIGIAVLSATSVFAQTANFAPISIAPGFSVASASGSTGGSFSLPSIANRDRNGNFCLGYGGSQTPDHIMTLQQDFPKLTIEVNSGNRPTTLLIKGPDDVIRCSNNRLEGTNFKAGRYEIWVGSQDPGVRGNYTLSVRE